MPSVKQGGGYTLTFAKKNEDVKKLLAKKKEIKGFVLTDYVCEAIRFFEANKDNIKEDKIRNIDIEELVKKEVAKIMGDISINTQEEIKVNSRDLEDNLDDIDVDDD